LALPKIFLTQANLLNDWLGTLVFVKASLLFSSFYIAFTLIIFARLDVINQMLRSKKKSTTTISFTTFTFYHTQTLRIIFQTNQILGLLMFYLILLFTPTNALIIMGLVLKLIPPIMVPCFFFCLVGQFIGIFCLHYNSSK